MRKQRGTTMIEVIAVISIMLVVTGILAPRMARIVGNLRLRSSVDTVGYMLQQARMRAVRDNKYYTVIGNVGAAGAVRVCVDLNWNGACDANEPQVELPQSVQFAQGGGVPATTAINCGTSNNAPACPAGITGLNYPAQDQTVLPTFNARGLPCINQAGAANEPSWNNPDVCISRDNGLGVPAGLAGNQIGFLYTFQYTGVLGGANYAALAVTPAGRITTWMYGGTNANGVPLWVR